MTEFVCFCVINRLTPLSLRQMKMKTTITVKTLIDKLNKQFNYSGYPEVIIGSLLQTVTNKQAIVYNLINRELVIEGTTCRDVIIFHYPNSPRIPIQREYIDASIENSIEMFTNKTIIKNTVKQIFRRVVAKNRDLEECYVVEKKRRKSEPRYDTYYILRTNKSIKLNSAEKARKYLVDNVE
jgi:hypothetical protein